MQVQVHSATVTGQAATLDQGQDGTLFFEIKNTGTTTLTGLSARLSLDPSMHFVDGSGLDRWNCDDEAVCALTGTLLPGRSTILSVVVNPSSHTEGKPPFEVTATLTGTGLAEVSGTAMVTVTKD